VGGQHGLREDVVERRHHQQRHALVAADDRGDRTEERALGWAIVASSPPQTPKNMANTSCRSGHHVAGLVEDRSERREAA
jgi:hypothetical protein